MSAGKGPDPRPNDRKVEPLLAVLEGKEEPRASAQGPSLYWKLLWAALVVIALLLLVLKQAF